MEQIDIVGALEAMYDAFRFTSINPGDDEANMKAERALAALRSGKLVVVDIETVKGILSSIALSDNTGDAKDAVEPLCKICGITPSDLHIDTLERKGLLPPYLRREEDDDD